MLELFSKCKCIFDHFAVYNPILRQYLSAFRAIGSLLKLSFSLFRRLPIANSIFIPAAGFVSLLKILHNLNVYFSWCIALWNEYTIFIITVIGLFLGLFSLLFVSRIAAANNKANHSARTKSLTLRIFPPSMQSSGCLKTNSLATHSARSPLSLSVIFPLSTHFPANTEKFSFNLSQAERKFVAQCHRRLSINAFDPNWVASLITSWWHRLSASFVLFSLHKFNKRRFSTNLQLFEIIQNSFQARKPILVPRKILQSNYWHSGWLFVVISVAARNLNVLSPASRSLSSFHWNWRYLRSDPYFTGNPADDAGSRSKN